MFNVNLVNYVNYIGLYSIVMQDFVLCSLVEIHPQALFRHERNFMAELLHSMQSASLSCQDAANPSLALLQALGDGLALIDNDDKHREPCFACTAYFTNERIEVSWVGDMRSALFQDGMVTKATRLHNFVEDTPDWAKGGHLTSKPEEYRRVVTRGLCAKGSEPPETVTWNIKGNYSFIVCTSGIHKYKRPEEYIHQTSDTITLSNQTLNNKAHGAYIIVKSM